MTEFVETITHERTVACRQCGSTDLSKDGFYGDSQYFLCRKCATKFAGSDGFPGMKHPKALIERALTLYYGGMSYQNAVVSLKQTDGVSVTKPTLWRWVTKFSELANRYTLTLKPRLGPIWLADETVVSLWGRQYYYWDMIDTDTRLLLSSHLSRTRTLTDAVKFFHMGKWRSQTRPEFLLTDKMTGYPLAFNKVFYSPYPDKRVQHFTSEGFASPTNINLLERFHSTLKQRTKVMRGLKEPGSARTVLDGFVTWYNFIRPHEGLGGKTPAMVAGLAVGPADWRTLIERGYQTPKKNPEVELEWPRRFRIE